MRITIRGASIRTPEIDQLTRQRFEFALLRFGHRVRSLEVHFADLNGPKGGADTRCVATLRMAAPNRLLVIEDTDEQVGAVVDRVADRLSRSVARTLDALTTWRHAPATWARP